jgi:hypothetical protein
VSPSDVPIQIFPSGERSVWRYCLEKTMQASGETLTAALVHATEGAMFSRWNESDEDYPLKSEERADMLRACEELWKIKTVKLRWPSL